MDVTVNVLFLKWVVTEFEYTIFFLFIKQYAVIIDNRENKKVIKTYNLEMTY